MKNLKIAIFAALFMTFALSAQVSVNVNLGTPPVWAPAERVETQYYFLPDIDTYYDVPLARFIYLKNGAWVRTASLPYRYRNYKLRGSNVQGTQEIIKFATHLHDKPIHYISTLSAACING